MLRIVALGMAVVIGCTLPSLCFIVPPGASHGCHGHHSPAPQPAHKCCASQQPAVVAPHPPPVFRISYVGLMNVAENDATPRGIIPALAMDSPSPPSPDVLRI